MRVFLFLLRFAILHTITYLIVGTLYYITWTQNYYSGSEPVFRDFLISELDGEVWDLARLWMIPIQILRGFIIAGLLYPLDSFLKNLSKYRKILWVWMFYSLMTGLASSLPAPGTLEGWVFMKETITFKIHVLIFSEVLLQGLILSTLFITLQEKVWAREGFDFG